MKRFPCLSAEDVSGETRTIPEEISDVLVFLSAYPGVSSEMIRRIMDSHREWDEDITGLFDNRGRFYDILCLKASAVKEELPRIINGEIEEVLERAEKVYLRDVLQDFEQIMTVRSAKDAYTCGEYLKKRINFAYMDAGVEIVDPQNTYLSPSCTLAPGVRILPGTMMYGETRVEKGACIGPNAVLSDAVIGEGAVVNASQIYESEIGAKTMVGPFAYVRPGCKIGMHVRIGDFVELKNSNIGDGTKVSHLTYIGDSDVGENVNFGCGTVTVNYDGKKKSRTTILDGAFIGCNTNLVAPVTVHEYAYTAAGSTVTVDVPRDALLIARSREVIKEGWAKKLRPRADECTANKED